MPADGWPPAESAAPLDHMDLKHAGITLNSLDALQVKTLLHEEAQLRNKPHFFVDLTWHSRSAMWAYRLYDLALNVSPNPSMLQLELPSLGDRLRGDFPILHQIKIVNGRPLIYLDSAATSQKPKQASHLIRPSMPGRTHRQVG